MNVADVLGFMGELFSLGKTLYDAATRSGKEPTVYLKHINSRLRKLPTRETEDELERLVNEGK